MIEHLDEFQELPYPWETLARWLRTGDLHFDAKVRRQGPTVLDPLVSYCVYHGPKIYTPYIVHNLYELIAFIAHPRHEIHWLEIVTRPHPKPKGFKIIPLPWEEVEIAEITATHGPEPIVVMLNANVYHTGQWGREWWP